MLMIALACAASVASGSFEHLLPLQTGDVRVEAMTRSARSAELARLSWQSTHPHAIVVLNHTDASADLTAHGLTLLRSLGGSTWIAAVAPTAANSTQVLDAISWIGAVDPTWKVHPYLASGGVPDWTIDQSASAALTAGERFDIESLLRELDEAADPRVVVYMLAHRDVSLDALAADLPVLADAAVLSKLQTVHGLTVAIPMSAIVPLAEDDRVLWIEPAMPRFDELNDQNREVTQADILQESPYGLDGDGVVVMVYDGGKAFSGHADFGGRLTERDTSSTSDHATHVSGTIGGDGSASGGQYRGMAPAVTIESYGFEQEGGLQEGFLYTDPGDLEAGKRPECLACIQVGSASIAESSRYLGEAEHDQCVGNPGQHEWPRARRHTHEHRDRCREHEDAAADDLVDADRREVPPTHGSNQATFAVVGLRAHSLPLRSALGAAASEINSGNATPRRERLDAPFE